MYKIWKYHDKVGDAPDIGGSRVVELFDIAGSRSEGGGTRWYAPLAAGEPG